MTSVQGRVLGYCHFKQWDTFLPTVNNDLFISHDLHIACLFVLLNGVICIITKSSNVAVSRYQEQNILRRPCF